MSVTYTPLTNFAAKDQMSSSNPNKVLSGVPFDAEFSEISDKFELCAPALAPVFTGNATFATADFDSITVNSEALTSADIVNWDATKATVDAGATGWDATKSTVDAGASNWNTAFGWGNHASAGYADGTNEANWDTAYGWGNHASAGYAADADIANASNWDTAYSWGNHASAGYATTTALNSATANSSNWDTAYSWGDHAAAGYSTTDTNTTYSGGTNITLSGTTFNLDSSLTGLTDVTTSAVSIGNWEIKLDGSDLRFVYNGTDVFKITTAGAIVAKDNITAYGSP